MRNRILPLMVLCFFMMLFSASLGQAPPPPAHSQYGNQVSPGGSGCPIDRTDGIVLTLALTLAFAGFKLYQKGRKIKNLSSEQ